VSADLTNVLQAGVATFFGLPQADPSNPGAVQAALAGVPWDEGNGGRNGANYGPRAFRDVSGWYLSYNAENDVDLWSALPAADIGDVQVLPPNAEQTMANIASHVRSVRDQGILPVLIGGNHSITIGAARGAAASVSGSMGYLSIDAHLDSAHDWAGEIYSSGCPTHRVSELPNVDGDNVVVFGVHGWLNPRSQVDSARDLGVTWYGMDRIDERGLDRALEEAIERATNGVEGLYVTFDQDSIDASHFPGTGTPEPGGFSARDAQRIARRLGATRPVAFDAVELAPIYDLSGISARLSCGLVMAFLTGVSEG
jgi:agmatinase